ncbi:MAG: hypothetical protein K5873_08970 [Treponema sp.]|nr:hypothetical protein [Treponema sp.]
MFSISDFVKISKKDTCRHLSSGMRFSSFIQWCGFMIPGFKEDSMKNAGSENDLFLRKEISLYTHTRIGSPHDIFLLFCHSISESITENITLLEGSVNVDYIDKCCNTTDFIDVIKNVCDKYSDKIKVRPVLGLDSDNENNLPLANMLLESGVFTGIELSGRGFVNNPEKFLSIFKTARSMNIDSKIGCLAFRDFEDRNAILEILQNLNPSVIVNPNIAIKDERLAVFSNGKIRPEVVSFLKDNEIETVFSPAPFLSGINSNEKNKAIREFAENGLKFSLCTEDMLYLNKSISEFAADLCNQGVFSKEELVSIISDKPSKA